MSGEPGLLVSCRTNSGTRGASAAVPLRLTGDKDLASTGVAHAGAVHTEIDVPVPAAGRSFGFP